MKGDKELREAHRVPQRLFGCHDGTRPKRMRMKDYAGCHERGSDDMEGHERWQHGSSRMPRAKKAMQGAHNQRLIIGSGNENCKTRDGMHITPSTTDTKQRSPHTES